MSATASEDRDYQAEHPEAYGSKGLRVVDKAGIYLRTRSLRKIVKSERPQRMLDLGCGYQANVIKSLSGQIPHLTGVDLEVAFASFEPRSFDLVTILSVLEHIPEPQEVLDGIHRVLAPGGTAIVHVPTWLGKPVLEWLAFKRGMGTASINDHRMYYRIPDLWPMMIKAGFRGQDVKMRYHTLGCALTATARPTV
jgi:SAM-dependent methyltransferase